MSLGQGWWLRNTPTPQTPREPSQSNNVNENKYSIVQQPGHIHLPGLAQKPQQHIIPVRKSQYPIPVPQLSVTSPRKRKTWQISETEKSYPRFNKNDGISKYHRYSDSKCDKALSNIPEPISAFSNQRVPEPVSVFSNQRVYEPVSTFSNQHVSKRNRNVACSLVSENDSSHEQKNNVIFASMQFTRPLFENGRYPQEQRCSNLKKPDSERQVFISCRPDSPRYSQNLKYSYLKNTHSEQPSLQSGDHMTDSPRYPQKPQYPSLQYLYQDQFSHPKSTKKTGFLPQIYSSNQIDSDETLNTSPRRKNWSSPICYYEDPTVFWVDMGIESGTLFLLLIEKVPMIIFFKSITLAN
jgi:hypothetical protein